MLKYMFECLVTFYSKLVDLNQWIISFISFGRSGSRVLRTLGKRCEYALLHNLGLPNQNTCFKGKKLYNLEVTHRANPSSGWNWRTWSYELPVILDAPPCCQLSHLRKQLSLFSQNSDNFVFIYRYYNHCFSLKSECEYVEKLHF